MKKNLSDIHKNISLIHGCMTEEYTEQTLSCKYINENDIVFEIGGNMGRNALIISNILNNDKNLVTLEPNKEFADKLLENRNYNNKNFYIENSALSRDKIFSLNSISFKEGTLEKDFPTSCKCINKNNASEANIIEYKDLIKKYEKNFNVLCVDCEGAFYYILKDMEYILDNIRLIIIENDYENIEHYNYVKNKLDKKFNCIEQLPLNNPPWPAPCSECFYQVWVKK